MMTKTLALCVVLCTCTLALTSASSPSPPSMPESFTASLFLNIVPWTSSSNSTVTSWIGTWLEDATNQRIRININESTWVFSNVQLYKQSTQYQIIPPLKRCTKSSISGWNTFFSWVKYASHTGQAIVRGVLCDRWEVSVQQQTMKLFVAHTTGTPLREVVQMGAQRATQIFDFLHFESGVPAAGNFALPPVCDAADPADHHARVVHDVDQGLEALARARHLL